MTTYDHQRTPAERGDYWVAIHTWVLDAGLSHNALCAYIGLASYADRAGHAWPSVGVVAERMSLSKRSVQRGIKELEELGLLQVRRPRGRESTSEYWLRMIAPAADALAPDEVVDGPHGPVWGDAQARPHDSGRQGGDTQTRGVTRRHPRVTRSPEKGDTQSHRTPPRNTSKEHLQGTQCARDADAVADEILDAEIVDDDYVDVGTLDIVPANAGSSRSPVRAAHASVEQEFEEFWGAFPRERRTAKRQCLQKFTKAVKDGTPPSTIIAAARRYAADPNRVAAYTASPLTWLNQGRWEDGPLPPRNGEAAPSPLGNTDHLTDEDWQRVGDFLWTPTDPCDVEDYARGLR